MSPIVSYTSYDFNNATLVPVIASFDSEGHIMPLYVRINGESFKIRSAWQKPSFGSTSVFQCQIEDNGTIKPLLLTFHQRENVWAMSKH